MNRILPVVAAIAVAGAGAWYLTAGQTTPGSTAVNPLVGAANAQTTDADANADIDTSSIEDMSQGNPDAEVTVIEYASFTCPHCAAFHAENYDKLKADYIDTDKINFVYREVFFDRYGLWASMVARCGGPEKFFGISDLIYDGQSEWVRAGEPAAIVDELRKIGRLAGLENDTLEACLQDGDKARTLVAWYEENAKQDGIDSTPSFIIDGKKYNNMPYDEMKSLIDAALND